MESGSDFFVSHCNGVLPDESRQVSGYLFRLGRELVRQKDVGVGVIVSSDDGAMEIASLAAGVIFATLSADFTKVAAPMSLYQWLRQMPAGATVVDRESGRRWQKIAPLPSDAAEWVRLAPQIPFRTEKARIFQSDNIPQRWGLENFALGIAADRPWIPLEEVKSLPKLDQDLDGATMSSLALYLSMRKSHWKVFREMIVQHQENRQITFPISDWLAIQSTDPRAFYRTRIVDSIEEMTGMLSHQRLPHTASRLTILFSGSMSDAVRRRAERSGYRKGERSLAIGAILPARQVGPDQLADLAASWHACFESNSERNAAQVALQELRERLGVVPAGIAVVPV